jgi:spore maturation protein CgeB
MRLTIIGGTHPTAVGQSLMSAAMERPGLQASFVNGDRAYGGPKLWQSLLWRLCHKRPARLSQFNREVLRRCRDGRSEVLICAGNMPLSKETLNALRQSGVRLGLYSTDDPWNLAHRTERFLGTLPSYDVVFTTRRANVQEFRDTGVKRVDYLPFGYDGRYFYPTDPEPGEECDLFFAGGADDDRMPLVEAIMKAGMRLNLYGGVWQRWKETRPVYRGYAEPTKLSAKIAAARVCLCLVRRANRDGTSMRSFELPAAGACMVVEDTQEHRELFGPDSEAVAYFESPQTLVLRMQELLANEGQRIEMKERSHQLMVAGGHRYEDRLEAMIRILSL